MFFASVQYVCSVDGISFRIIQTGKLPMMDPMKLVETAITTEMPLAAKLAVSITNTCTGSSSYLSSSLPCSDSFLSFSLSVSSSSESFCWTNASESSYGISEWNDPTNRTTTWSNPVVVFADCLYKFKPRSCKETILDAALSIVDYHRNHHFGRNLPFLNYWIVILSLKWMAVMKKWYTSKNKSVKKY